MKVNNQDLVSVITPTYNCGRFISETINSVIAQTYTNWEMIIYDDCSTDNTRDVVDSFIDSRIRYFCNEHNCGAAITRNNALREAKGRWIAFLDSDDMWRPTKLEKQISFMVENNYAFSYHNYVEIDEESKEIGVLVSGKSVIGKFGLYSCCWPGCLTVMYDANVVGLIQIADVKKHNDLAIWFKVIEKSNLFLLPDNLAYYRRRKGSITPAKYSEKMRYYYRLFASAMNMNTICASFWTGISAIGHIYKSLFFVNSYKQ